MGERVLRVLLLYVNYLLVLSFICNQFRQQQQLMGVEMFTRGSMLHA